MRETLATEREAEVEEAGRRGGRGGRLMLELLQRPWVRALAPLVLVLIIGFIFNAHGAFYAWGTHRDMLRQVSVGGILACGMTLVIITGGIDLSVGSLLGFSAVLFSLLTIHQAWPALAAIAVVLAAGGACGLVSGELVARFKMQPFIATLAMMVFAPGPGQVHLRRREGLTGGADAGRQLRSTWTCRGSSRSSTARCWGAT